MSTYYLSDDTIRALQSVGETVQKFQLQLTSSPELKLAIEQQRKLVQSVGKMAIELLVQMDPTFIQLSQLGIVYQEQIVSLSKIVQASGITETLQRVSDQLSMLDVSKINLNPLINLPKPEPETSEFVVSEIPTEVTREVEAALEESGIATSEEPNKENINYFKLIQTTLNHPLAKEIGIGIVLNIIMTLIFLTLMQLGVDLKKKNNEKEDEEYLIFFQFEVLYQFLYPQTKLLMPMLNFNYFSKMFFQCN